MRAARESGGAVDTEYRVRLPDGTLAAPAEMNEAQEAVKAYIVETQEYLSCLEAEAKGNFTPEITARYNEATNRMSSLAM